MSDADATRMARPGRDLAAGAPVDRVLPVVVEAFRAHGFRPTSPAKGQLARFRHGSAGMWAINEVTAGTLPIGLIPGVGKRSMVFEVVVEPRPSGTDQTVVRVWARRSSTAPAARTVPVFLAALDEAAGRLSTAGIAVTWGELSETPRAAT